MEGGIMAKDTSQQDDDAMQDLPQLDPDELKDTQLEEDNDSY
jgi:hypothetical protein